MSMTIAQGVIRDRAPEKKWHDDFVFGGGLGAGFNNGWNINATPFAGYKLTDRIIAGVGLEFYYASFRFDSRNKDRYTVIGPRVFGLYQISDVINATAEFASYRFDLRNIRNDQEIASTNGSQESLLLGGGYLQRFGDRSGLRIELLYDVLYDDDADVNFRNSPFVPRISFVYGL